MEADRPGVPIGGAPLDALLDAGGALVVLGATEASVDEVVGELIARWPHRSHPHVARAEPADADDPGRCTRELASGLPGPPGSGLVARVQRVAADGPVLVVLDRAHHADQVSLDAIAELAEHCADRPVSLLVGGTSTPTLVRWADRLEATGRVEVVELRPSPPPSYAARASLADHTAAERDLLLAVAVLGAPARISDAAATGALDVAVAASVADALVEAGALHDAGPGRVGFGRTRAPDVLAEAGPGARLLAHRRAFELLHGRGQTTAAAGHGIEGDLVADRRAIDAAAREAEHALGRGAVDEALRWSAGALRLAGAAATPQLLGFHGDALVAAGLPAQAVADYRAAIACLGDDASAHGVDLRRRLARALAYSGDLDGSTEASHDAWRRSHVAPDRRAEIAIEHVHALWQQAGPAGALPQLEAYEATGALPDDPLVAVMAGYVRLWATTGRVDVDRVLAAARRADDPTQSTPFDPTLCATGAARVAERWELDEGVLRARIVEAEVAGRAHGVVAQRISLTDSLIRQGRPQEALQELAGIERGLFPLLSEAIDIVAAFAELEQHHLEGLEARLDGLPESGMMWSSELWLRHARAALELFRGDAEAASAAYRELAATSASLGVGLPEGVPWAEHALEAHGGAGDLDAIDDLIDWLGARPFGASTWRTAMVHLGRALRAEAREELDDAEVHLDAAAAGGDARPLVRARLLLRGAELRRRAGRRADARPLYREALPAFEVAGAHADVARCRAGLRAVGGRRVSARAVPSGLTPQEHRVAALAAAGRTTLEIANELFISSKTVETHLTHAYGKLGVRSKRELHGRDLGPTPET